MSDANLQAVFFDFDGVICQTEVCRLDALEVRLHALGLHPDRRGLYRMVSGGLGSREAAMDALLGSQPLYWQHREEVLARHPIRFCYPQLLTPGLPEVLHTLHSAGLVLAVVSNSSVEVVDGALQQCGIRPYFQQIFSGWQIPRSQRLTALSVTCSCSASSAWVRPCALRTRARKAPNIFASMQITSFSTE